METVEVLRKARELLSDPKRWTKGTMARDANGAEVSARPGYGACSWCAMGAIIHVDGHSDEAAIAEEALRDATGSVQSISQFNDRAEHEDVLALFDSAIASQESP